LQQEEVDELFKIPEEALRKIKSLKEYNDYFHELYKHGIELSEGSISNITNAVPDNIKEWQRRPSEPVYFVVWMDGLVMKIRQNGKILGKTIYPMIRKPKRMSIWRLSILRKNGPCPQGTGDQL
jgi:hypothetical protein